MRKQNKRALYERIMQQVSKSVKKALNESQELDPRIINFANKIGFDLSKIVTTKDMHGDIVYLFGRVTKTGAETYRDEERLEPYRFKYNIIGIRKSDNYYIRTFFDSQGRNDWHLDGPGETWRDVFSGDIEQVLKNKIDTYIIK